MIKYKNERTNSRRPPMKKVFLTGGALFIAAVMGLVACATGPDPLEREAMSALLYTYQRTNLWEVRELEVLNTAPVNRPPQHFLNEHKPKEVWCVCLKFMTRYRVPWSTVGQGKWKTEVRNILVIRNRDDRYVALGVQGICPPLCD